MIPDTYEDDELETQALNERAWELRYVDIAQAATLAQRAMERAGPAEHPRSRRQLADSLRTLSHCSERGGSYQRAIAYASQALTLYRLLDDRAGAATALYLLASAYWSIGDYSASLTHAHQSVSDAEQSDSPTPHARALNIIGLVYQSTNNLADALRYFTAALAIYLQTDDRLGQADTRYNRAETFLMLGQLDEALTEAHEALALHQATAYLHDLGMCFALVGRVTRAHGRLDEARAIFEQGLAVSERSGNAYSRLLCLITLAELDLQSKAYASASAMLTVALDLSHQLDAKDERRQCHEGLATIYEACGDPGQALAHYREFHRLTDELRTNTSIHQLRNLELAHQVERTRQERTFYQQKHAELAAEVRERMRVEHELRKRLEEISMLNRVTRLVLHHGDLAAILGEVTQALNEIAGVRGAMIVLLDERQETLGFGAARDRGQPDTRLLGVSYPTAAIPLCRQVLADRQVRALSAEEAALLLGPLAERFVAARLKHLYLIPLVMHEVMIGGLVITDDQDQPTLSVLDLERLGATASQVAAAIEHMRRFEAAERAREAAEAASREKSRFVATVSHELLTPLTGVFGIIGLLRDTELSPLQREYISVIHTGAETLLHLIGNILDFPKIEVGKLELQEQAFNLYACCRAAVGLNQFTATSKGLALSVTIAPGTPEHVVGDEARLRQVLINLLGNAVKFSDHGTVVLHLQGAELAGHRSRVRISVSDSGIGIPPERQADIFQPFVQAHAATTQQYGGSGLGLAISKQLIELMGGTIELTSRLGEGSTFTVSLPLAVADVARVPHDAPGAPASAAPERLRLLVAEDNPINQDVLRRLLERLGHSVEVVDNGLEAVAAVRRSRYDAVLMDIQMPVLDGLEATRQIRALGDEHRPLVIALTASALAGDRERYFAAGMDDFLSKPLQINDLNRALEGVAAKDLRDAPDAPKDDLVDWEFVENLARPLGVAQQELGALVLDLVRNELAAQLDELAEAVRAADRDQIRRRAHRMAGGGRQIGAAALAACCQRLEDEAARMPIPEMARLTEQARRLYAQTLAEFLQRLGGPPQRG